MLFVQRYSVHSSSSESKMNIWFNKYVSWSQGYKSKEEGKDHELLQSITTPDPGYYMGKWQKHKKASRTREPRG